MARRLLSSALFVILAMVVVSLFVTIDVVLSLGKVCGTILGTLLFWAIVRWTTNSVDGSTVRYGVVHFGVDPRDLRQLAKSQNRWNRGLPSMTYRVSVDNLEPGLTYYYRVEFTDANGKTEGADGAVHQFTTQRQQ